MKHLLFCFLALLPSLVARSQTRPVITSFAPQTGPIGTPLIISGSGFAATAAQNVVRIGGARASVTAASATQLTVMVPGGAVAPASVEVTNTATHLRGEAPGFRLTAAGGTVNTGMFQRQNFDFGFTHNYMTVADASGDGNADVLTGGYSVGGSPDVLLAMGTGTGTLQVPPVPLSAGLYPSRTVVADFTGDGLSDLLVASQGGDVSLLEALPTGGFTAARTIYSVPATATYNVITADFDGDGWLDVGLQANIYSAPGNSNRVVRLLNQGNGNFTVGAFIPDPFIAQLVGAVDLTGDGLPELFSLSTNGGTLDVRTALAGGGYGAIEQTLVSAAGELFTPSHLVDLNGDGRVDLLGASAVNYTSGPYSISVRLRNAANNGFEPLAIVATTSNRVAGAPLTPIDIDGDGDLDIAGSLQSLGGFGVYLNNGAGQFTAGPTFSNSYGVMTLQAADLNNDGRADLVSGSSAFNFVATYLNTATTPGQNNPPTLNPLADLNLSEDAPEQVLALSGITNGGEPGQGVVLTATSSDPSLVPNPGISYFSPGSTATLRLQPLPDAFGTCTITVTASDGQSQNGTFSRTFQVTVAPVNDAPTLDAIPDVVITTVQNAGYALQVPVTGITSGAANENQILSLSALFSVNQQAGGLPNGTFQYTSPGTSGTYETTLNIFGGLPRLLATITVTVSDGQASNSAITRTFRVYYNPGGTGTNIPASPPTLNAIADMTADRALSTQLPVPLSGITDGDPAQVLPLTVTAISSDPGLVGLLPVNYLSPAAAGSLLYIISSTRSGTALVSVTVSNGQPSNGSVTRSFRIIVPAVVTGTSRAGAAPEVQLYPNPSTDGRSYLAVSGVAGPVTVQVLDALGRQLSEQRWAQCPARVEVSLPAAVPGTYVVRVLSAGGVFTRRLLLH